MLVKMLFKYGKQRWSLLWTLLLIFQLYDNGVSGAPTKHLKITAKGDTPRLIVTSEEDFGSEPKRLVAANSKNYQTTTPILPTPTQTPTPTPTLLAIKQDIVDKSYETDLLKKLETATSTTTTDKLLFNNNAEGKNVPTTEEYKYALGETTTITTKTTLPLIAKNTTILKHQYATTSNMLQQQHEQQQHDEQIETTTISLLEQIKIQEPIQIKNVNKNIKESIYDDITTPATTTTTKTTTTSIVNNMIEKMPKKKNQRDEGEQEQEVTPVAEHELLTMEENKKYISTTMEMPITKVATTTTTTLKPVTNIAVIDKLNDKMMISNSEKTDTATTEATASTHTPQVEHMNFQSANSTIVSVATLTEKHEEHDVTTTTTTTTTTTVSNILPKLTTYNPKPTSFKVATTANTKASGSGSGSGSFVTTEVPSFHSKDDVMLNDQSGLEDAGGAVRLLDLEKQEPKSFAFERKHQSTKATVADVDVLTALDFDGHDGIKKTKKKQLKIDKHMLADIAIENIPTSTTTSTTTTTKTYKVKKSGKNNKTKFLSDSSTSATHSLGPIHMDEKVLPKPQESKISDIQVEIYDSTVDSLLNTALKASTTKTPTIPELQEKFTQYVVDRVESSTSESNLLPTMAANLLNFGKPEPAAIEIHINVSEGMGNGSEDLEFSYPQTNFEANEAPLKSLKVSHSKAKNSSNTDEILVVEIIDAGDNSTDNALSAENIHPVFTFRTDQSVNEIEFKDNVKKSSKVAPQTDELFMAEVKPDVSVAPPIVKRPTVEHDSDTIFYISNTEVKVGESPTLANMKTTAHKSKQKSKLNAAYSLSTHPNSARYEEDILLSPLQNTADSLKIFRSQNEENAPPLDVTYVGESVMEVEQLPPEEKEQSEVSVSVSQQVGTTSTSAPSHVIIQPATLSEIGVPVIGELPPQIELKEFDFMPDELTNHEQHSGSMSGAEEESGHVEEEQTLVGNDVERLVESSIQYGGDLIDEGAVDNGGGFDGAEGSYPFGNLATMGRHGRQNAKRKQGAHFNVHHGVNNLRKDELSVDINGRDGKVAATAADEAAMQLNGTLKYAEQTMHNVSDASMNITFAIAERMTNGTFSSLMENPKRKSLNVNDEFYLSMASLTGSVIIATLPVITIFALFCTLRYFYHQYRSHTNEDDNTGMSQQAKIDGSGEHGSTSAANAGNSQDISRNARETKMHYNNSTGKDGVFVVEVSRGADSQQIPESPLSETAATFIQTLTTTNASTSATKPNSLLEKNEKSPILQEEVQVHEPPKDVEDNKKLNQIPELEEEKTDMLRSNTGLSQSDLSLNSSSNSNKDYTYGNQTLYDENTSKVIKLQTEKPNQNIQNEGNYENTYNDMNIPSNMVEEKQKETIANEAIEMDNKLQMQVTTEPVVESESEPEHNIEINNATQPADIAVTTLEETETIGKQENMEKCINANAEEPAVFDSLMSLPEPPSYEEINQIGVSVVGDTAQLDSLPPPPPPPLFVAEQADETVANVEALQQYALNNIKIVPPPPSCTTAKIDLNNGKEQLLSTQLTPPESPPGANCANNRGKAAGICLPLPALAVNVNGS